MTKTIMITGATSGIGESCARLLAGTGTDLLSGRRLDRLERLQDEILKAGAAGTHSLCLDIRDRSAVHAGIAGLPDNGSR
jgi:3-hydroxy acid dehydrogenase / malonic semialdehyde reductase